MHPLGCKLNQDLDHGLLFNPAETETVLLGTKVQRDKSTTASSIDAVGTVVPFCDSVSLFGVTRDMAL